MNRKPLIVGHIIFTILMVFIIHQSGRKKPNSPIAKDAMQVAATRSHPAFRRL